MHVHNLSDAEHGLLYKLSFFTLIFDIVFKPACDFLTIFFSLTT